MKVEIYKWGGVVGAMIFGMGSYATPPRVVPVNVPGSIEWQRTADQYVPDDQEDTVTITNIFGLDIGLATARVISQADHIHGGGTAFDFTINDEARSAVVAVGVRSETWTLIAAPAGGNTLTASLGGTLKIAGAAMLTNAPCAAGALGYTEVKGTLVADNIGPFSTALTTSAGQTQSDKLGDMTVAYGGASATYSPSYGTMTGPYPDKDVLPFAESKSVNVTGFGSTFFWYQRSRGYMVVWADGSPINPAKSSANLSGNIDLTVSMNCVPQ